MVLTCEEDHEDKEKLIYSSNSKFIKTQLSFWRFFYDVNGDNISFYLIYDNLSCCELGRPQIISYEGKISSLASLKINKPVKKYITGDLENIIRGCKFSIPYSDMDSEMFLKIHFNTIEGEELFFIPCEVDFNITPSRLNAIRPGLYQEYIQFKKANRICCTIL